MYGQEMTMIMWRSKRIRLPMVNMKKSGKATSWRQIPWFSRAITGNMSVDDSFCICMTEEALHEAQLKTVEVLNGTAHLSNSAMGFGHMNVGM